MKITKYKSNCDYSYTLGITLTIELLKMRPKDVRVIYIHSSYTNSDNSKILNELIKKYNIECIYSDKIFNILQDKENCYVIGVFNKYKSNLVNGNHIALVNPSNSGNLGTIIRTCIGFGIKNLAIISPAVDIYDPKTVRASMGAIFHMNFEYFDSFNDYLKRFNNNIYTFMLQSNNNLKDVKFIEPFTLTFGNEATGLDNSYLDYNNVIIKKNNDIDSFNLPIACSIALYEATKNKF